MQAITAFRAKPSTSNNMMHTVANNTQMISIDKNVRRRRSSADLSDELGNTLKTNSTINIPLSSISSNVSTGKNDLSTSIGGDLPNNSLKDGSKNVKENGTSLLKSSLFQEKLQNQSCDSSIENKNSEMSLPSALDKPIPSKVPHIVYVIHFII